MKPLALRIMNLMKSPLIRFWLLSILGVAVLPSSLCAQTATQTITLMPGWNSVWLEVEPKDEEANAKSPEDVFTDPAIELVTTPKPLAGLADFFASDPGTISTFNQDEWLRWKRTAPPTPNNLPTISRNRPYLIQVTGAAPVTVTLTGEASFFRPTWTPDRYNLVGFGLEGSPTFDAFFGPSGGKHLVSKIFRLNTNGIWGNVLGTDTMVSGQAYWVFSSGPSRYMGPVSVEFDQSILGALNFGGPSDVVGVGSGVDALELDLEEIIFSNLGSGSASPGLDLISTSAGQGSLALHVVSPDGLGYTRGNQVDSSVGVGEGAALGETVDASKTAILTIGAQRDWALGSPDRTNLYRLKTGGASFWLPVTARNSDLQLPTDGTPLSESDSVTGLWVGEVILNASTSIVVDGAPTQPTAGVAPMRVLLHYDGSNVRLLSQVTVMQTKTADPEVLAEPVLVVDPAKIPFFEGIKERNGRKVGIRIEAVAYDMPRDSSAAAQTVGAGDLIDMIVAESTSPVTKWLSGKNLYTTRESVTQAAIDSYILFRSIRPPSLKEIYKLSLPMSGALGAGKTVVTSNANPLVLDPFHRSNPFRHAYHQRHTKGVNITRSFEIVFDPEQTISDRLTGTFSETIQGLIKSDLELTGRVEFTRISPVGTLN